MTFILDLWILIDFCSFLSLIYCLLTKLTRPTVGLFVAYGYTQIISRLITGKHQVFSHLKVAPKTLDTFRGTCLRIEIKLHFWLVASTPLKSIGQLGLLFPIYGKNKCSKPPSRFLFFLLWLMIFSGKITTFNDLSAVGYTSSAVKTVIHCPIVVGVKNVV